jgi:tetratricopeptide (TPR) repeat protein
MTLPPSRLLTRLDAAITAERDPFRADLLRAERAAYWARQGQAEEARTELDALHKRYDARPNFEMSVWLSIAESLACYLTDIGPLAPDKMRRARALSEAAGLKPLQALSSAWLAQMDYNAQEFGQMTKHVGDALRLAAADHDAARSRANLVVAQAIHLSCRMDLATPWYKRAQEHAVAEGDEATLSAMMHNMSWLRMHVLRQEKMTGVASGAAGAHALLGIESTVQYDNLWGLSSLESLKPILRAQILALEGEPDKALTLFDEHLPNQPDGMLRMQCILLADRAWCLVEVGRSEEARIAADVAESSILPVTTIDDRAAAHSRLAQVFRAVDEPERATQHLALADEAWRTYVALQREIGTLLRDFTEHGPR